MQRGTVPCAKRRSGAAAVQVVSDGSPGDECLTDHEGHPMTVMPSGSTDLATGAVVTVSHDLTTRMDHNGKPSN